MKNKVRIASLMAMVVMLAACGSSSSTTTAASPVISDVSQLPKATSPMESVSANLASKSLSKAASSGLNLLSATAGSFDTTDSMAACETFNVVKDSIVSASQADQILCYVQNMNDAFSTVTDGSGGAVNVYDGNWHVFNLNIVGATEGAPDKVKMRIVKNAAGSVTSFTMFMCKTVDSVKTQNEYTSQTLDGTSFTMTSKGNFASAQWSGGHQVDVTGTLNSSGVFTQKQIVMKNTGGATGDSSNTNWQEATLIQTPGVFTVSGYQKGTYSSGSNTGSYQQAAYAAGEMLGDTSTTLSNLAMGDGAVNVDSLYSWSNDQGQGSYNPSATVFAWLGDTLAALDPASGSSFYATASAGTIPTPEASQISISFSTDETWDCTDDAITLPSVEEATISAACSQYGSMSHSWIDCYSAIGQYQQQ